MVVMSREIPGTPKDMGPPATHTTPMPLPQESLEVWEAYGKGVPLVRVPEKIPNNG